MRFVEELRDKYKNKTIWIVGAGPSLDKIPDDFFDDKICIFLSWTFIAFQRCFRENENAYVTAAHRVEPNYIKENSPELLKRCIFSLAPKENIMLYGLLDPKNYGKEPYYMRWLGAIDGEKEDFQETTQNILEKKETQYVQKGTTLHFGIQAAAVMGAKKIILAGCDMKTSHYYWYAQKRGLDKVYLSDARRPGEEFPPAYQQGKTKDFRFYKQGVYWLKEMLKPKVKILRYEYPKGEMEIEEEKLEIKLQIGGSQNLFLTHYGFQIIDFPSFSGVTYIHDFAKTLPLEDNSVEEIIALHSIERLSQDEVALLLWECCRILEPGARFLMVVSDFNWIVRSFLENGGLLTPDILKRLYGDFWVREFSYRNCFNLSNLIVAIKAAGFRKFKLLKLDGLKELFPNEGHNIDSICQTGDIILEVFKSKTQVLNLEEEEDK